MGTYATLEDVKSHTQFTTSTTTTPTTQQVTEWLEQAEDEIEENSLAEHILENIYLDVPTEKSDHGVYDQEYNVSTGTLTTNTDQRTLHVPLTNIRKPLREIIKLEKNDEAYSDAPNWTTLTEGPADGSSFLLRQSGDKQQGYMLVFYDNPPLAGPKRIRLTYKYGHNVKTGIIREWVSRTVAVKVLQALMGSNSVTGLQMIDMGGDVPFIYNTNYKDRLAENMRRLNEIEEKYFPNKATDTATYITL